MKSPVVALISKAMIHLRADMCAEQKRLAYELSKYRAAVSRNDIAAAAYMQQNMQHISRTLRLLHLTSCIIRSVPYRMAEATTGWDNHLTSVHCSNIANMVWAYTGINLNVDRVTNWLVFGVQPMLLPEDVENDEVINAF